MRASDAATRAAQLDSGFPLQEKGLLSNPLLALRPDIGMAVSTVQDVGGMADFHQQRSDLSEAASIGRAVEARPIR